MDAIKNLPSCPKCQTSMALMRVIPRVGSHPEIQTFQCRVCREVLKEVKETR
jgi:hypothetical protein